VEKDSSKQQTPQPTTSTQVNMESLEILLATFCSGLLSHFTNLSQKVATLQNDVNQLKKRLNK
jgi:hypothetical protein